MAVNVAIIILLLPEGNEQVVEQVNNLYVAILMK